jgi:hypothetical protein
VQLELLANGGAFVVAEASADKSRQAAQNSRFENHARLWSSCVSSISFLFSFFFLFSNQKKSDAFAQVFEKQG